MPFKFFKLADVQENQVIEESTNVLVTNGENVEKTPAKLISGSSYKDISSDYATWAQSHLSPEPGTPSSIVDFLKTIEKDTKPKTYYFDAYSVSYSAPIGGTCIVEVYGDAKHAEYVYNIFNHGAFTYYLFCVDLLNNAITYSEYLEDKQDGWTKIIDNIVESITLFKARQGSFGQNVKLGTDENSDVVYLSNDANNNGCLKLDNGSSTAVKVKNVGTPTDNNDATNKTYVDGKDVASANINSSGVISFNNSSGVSLFTLQLPLYSGSIEEV